ncbi:MAG TPA: hypothetical protein EYP20_05065, partial [Aigarchaeota archaeon]|nr:hypothetical protein [Aigarchaeota archaeon]
MVIRAEKVEDRFGEEAYRCPLCGHVFYKSKQYVKHVLKSHIVGGFKSKRLRKKLEKYLKDIEKKLKEGIKLKGIEEVIYKKC